MITNDLENSGKEESFLIFCIEDNNVHWFSMLRIPF